MPFTIKQTQLKDVILITREIFEDHRGTYVEPYNHKEFSEKSINIKFVRDCISSSDEHVLRGIHYDDNTWKLVQCICGKIYFVVIDMRRESKQYLKWESFILTDTNRHQLLVPPGFGNAHLVLSDRVTFHYKMSEYYDPENEKILRWDDPKAKIFWPVKNPILSDKDQHAPFLE